MSRRYLFLQGPAGPFFARLADRVAREGHEVSRIDFCAGDAFDWRGRASHAFRGRLEDLPAFLEALFAREGFTDVVLFGDQRPVHRVAIAVARRHGAEVHVFEEGYLRPHWITLERDGVNAASTLPRDPAWYREASRHVVERPPVELACANFARGWHNSWYRVANALNPILHPGYRSHRPRNATFETVGWVARYLATRLAKRRDAAVIERLAAAGEPWFLLPLQLDSDAQVRCHSRYAGMAEILGEVLTSFARHAPAGSRLLVKNHPFDNGLVPHGRAVRALSRALGVEARVSFVETGDLESILRRCHGVVTLNSTVGLHAIGLGRRTRVLGQAVYDLPGLVAQEPLDRFWQGTAPPDASLQAAVRKVLLAATQVNGGFYSRQGIGLAVAGCDALFAQEAPLDRLRALCPVAAPRVAA